MYLIAQQQEAQENKGKAKKISFGIHLALLLILLIPIIRPNSEPKDFERAIVIDFEEPVKFTDDSSNKKSGTSAAAAKEESAPPREKVQVNKIQKKPVQQQVAMKVPERKQIITTPTPEIPIPEVKETKSEVIEPVEEIVEEVPDALPVPDPVPVVEEPVDEPVEEIAEEAEEEAPVVDKSWADGLGKTGSGQGTSDKPSKGNSDTGIPGLSDGDGKTAGDGKGDGNKGKDTGIGNEGLGDFWGDAPGDGMLTRPIKTRANAARLAIEKGTAVFSICVNRKGTVVWVEYDSERSTISDASMIEPLEKLMEEYVFEQDYTAPKQQCGKWTIKVNK